jgi:hypothetical protein
MADARDHENDATIGSEKKKDGRWFTGGTPRRTHAANEGSRAGGLPTTDFAPELDLQVPTAHRGLRHRRRNGSLLDLKKYAKHVVIPT